MSARHSCARAVPCAAASWQPYDPRKSLAENEAFNPPPPPQAPRLAAPALLPPRTLLVVRYATRAALDGLRQALFALRDASSACIPRTADAQPAAQQQQRATPIRGRRTAQDSSAEAACGPRAMSIGAGGWHGTEGACPARPRAICADSRVVKGIIFMSSRLPAQAASRRRPAGSVPRSPRVRRCSRTAAFLGGPRAAAPCLRHHTASLSAPPPPRVTGPCHG